MMLAVFAMAFGTRHVDATEHQDGLMLAVAMESLVKLAAFLAVGVFVTFCMFDGLGDLYRAGHGRPSRRARAGAQSPTLGTWVACSRCCRRAACIMLLPRQFHVTVVENRDETRLKRAALAVPALSRARSTSS